MFDFEKKKRIGQYIGGSGGRAIAGSIKTQTPKKKVPVTAAEIQVSRYNGTNQTMEDGNITNEWMPKDPAGQNQLWRQIYMHCGVAGPTIDLISALPWSEYDLVGMTDKSHLALFEDSMTNLKIEGLMQPLTAEFLTFGHICTSLMFDGDKGIWTGMIPHDPDTVTVTPVGIFGQQPKLDLQMSNTLKKMMTGGDERDDFYLKQIPTALLDELAQGGKIPLNPLNTLYIPRKTFMTDQVGTSLLTRIIPLFALEQSLLTGTLIAARRRQRSILHLVAGIDDVWEPSAADIDNLVQLFMQADEDPQGAIVGTPTGVQVNEVRSGNDFWKISDESSYIQESKMRALGVSEAFLTGEANYSTSEIALSVFIEQVRNLRNYLTRQMFYYNLFPTISRAHGLRKIKKNELEHRIKIKKTIDEQNEEVKSNQVMLAKFFAEQDAKIQKNHNFVMQELAKGNKIGNFTRRMMAADEAEAIPQSELLYPTIHWHKQLQPVSDDNYLSTLEKMEEKGIPIPLKIWASAGGVDIQKIMNGLGDDAGLRKAIHEWKRGAMEEEDSAFGKVLDIKKALSSHLPLWGTKDKLLGLEKKEFDKYLDHLKQYPITSMLDDAFMNGELHRYFQNNFKVESAKLVMKRLGLSNLEPDKDAVVAADKNMIDAEIDTTARLKEVQVLTKRKAKRDPSASFKRADLKSRKGKLGASKPKYFSGV